MLPPCCLNRFSSSTMLVHTSHCPHTCFAACLDLRLRHSWFVRLGISCIFPRLACFSVCLDWHSTFLFHMRARKVPTRICVQHTLNGKRNVKLSVPCHGHWLGARGTQRHPSFQDRSPDARFPGLISMQVDRMPNIPANIQAMLPADGLLMFTMGGWVGPDRQSGSRAARPAHDLYGQDWLACWPCRASLASLEPSSWLLLGNILHFCLFWLSGKPPLNC